MTTFTSRCRRALVGSLVALLALAGPASASPGASPDPTAAPDPNLSQVVTPDEKVVTEPAEVGDGHVDIGPKFVEGRMVLLGRDDTVTPKVWRPLDQLVLRVNDKALLQVPDDKNYAFLQIPAGKKVHVVPQTQLPGVLWLGWNTQDPHVTRTIGRGADLVLLRHQGPGRLHVFLGNGFDAPLPLWDSQKPTGQKIFMQNNTHVHANWVFTEPGIHLVEVEVQAKNPSGTPVSARAVLHLAVGDQVSAQQARSAGFRSDASASVSTASTGGSSTASATAVSTGPASHGSESTAEAARGVSPAWLAGGGVALLALIAGGFAMRQRRLREQAWAESSQEGGQVDDEQ